MQPGHALSFAVTCPWPVRTTLSTGRGFRETETEMPIYRGLGNKQMSFRSYGPRAPSYPLQA
eukprot:366393-Chlamydomonas_euryale.AAC.8